MSDAKPFTFNDEELMKSSKMELYDLIRTGEFSDLSLETTDGQLVTVHKNVLATTCKYFREMFNSPKYIESKMGTIKLTNDVTKEYLDVILKYLYTGSVEIHNLKQIYIKAQFFLLENLKNYCSDLLIEDINNENCLELFRFSGKYLADHLKTAILKYFCRNFENLFDLFLLKLTEEEMEYFISNRNYFASIENQEKLFLALLSWVKMDLKNREKFLTEFVKTINFQSLSNSFIQNEVLNDDNLKLCHFSTAEMMKIVMQKSRDGKNCVKKKKIFMVNNKGLEKLNRDNEKWENHSKFDNEYKWGFSSCEHKNSLFLSGGWNCHESISEFYSYQLSTNETVILPSMLEGRERHRIISLNDKIFACGGDGNKGSVEFFDFGQDKWLKANSLNKSKHAFGLTKYENCLYAFGGRLDGTQYVISNSIEMFDERNGKWEIIGQIPDFHKKILDLNRTAVLGQQILCVEPRGGGKIFDPRNRQWTSDKIKKYCDGLKVKWPCWNHFDIIDFKENVFGVFEYLESESTAGSWKTLKLNQSKTKWVDLEIGECDWAPIIRSKTTIDLNCLDI